MKSEETRIRKQTRTTLLSAGTSGASSYRDRRDPNVAPSAYKSGVLPQYEFVPLSVIESNQWEKGKGKGRFLEHFQH